jgi:hypothetical protein
MVGELTNDEAAADSEVGDLPEPPPSHSSTDNASTDNASASADAAPAASTYVDRGGSTSSNSANKQNLVSPPNESKPAARDTSEAETPKKRAPDKSGVTPTKSPSPEDGQFNISKNSSASRWLPDDKRSCRVLAGDGLLL